MKIPKTTIAFDYDLWTTEDGKCMVRVKRTGEVSEVDRKVMRILRAEEKRIGVLGIFIVHPFRCAGAAGRVKTEKEPHDGEV